MFTTFLMCAVIGGTVFVFQFVTSLVGLGAEDINFGDATLDDALDSIDAQGDVLDHGSTSLFGVLSFRTIVAALTFFGLLPHGSAEYATAKAVRERKYSGDEGGRAAAESAAHGAVVELGEVLTGRSGRKEPGDRMYRVEPR